MNKIVPDNTPRCSPKDWSDKILKAASNLSISVPTASSKKEDEMEEE